MKRKGSKKREEILKHPRGSRGHTLEKEKVKEENERKK